MTNTVADSLQSQIPNIPFLMDRENLKRAVDEIIRLQAVLDQPDQISVSLNTVQQLVQILEIAVNNPFAFNNLVTQTACAEVREQLIKLINNNHRNTTDVTA